MVRIEKIIKIVGLNILIAIINVILFSPGLVGIKIGGTSVFKTALGATVIIMSIMIFIFGNYKLLIKKEMKIKTDEIETLIDCINSLQQNQWKKTFAKDIVMILKQIQRMEKKKEVIKDVLLQKFNSTEMTYLKFEGVILDIDKLLFINIKSVVNKLNIFDEEDYENLRKDISKNELSKEFINTKMSIYNEYIAFIKDSIEDNEQILLKLDKLLLELSQFNSLGNGEIENMSAMKEIDELISKTKFYK
ncbi:MAG: hypothetical protein ACRC68_19070 [Clostridium sp.]